MLSLGVSVGMEGSTRMGLRVIKNKVEETRTKGLCTSSQCLKPSRSIQMPSVHRA